jgi:predicted lipoprotein
MNWIKMGILLVAGVVLAGLLTIALSGCSAISGACAETAASRASAAALIDDAELSLDQAEAVIAKIANGDVRTKAAMALEAARAALRSSAAGLSGVKNVCESFDVKSAFSDFIAAWKALAPFLSLLGGPSAGSQVQAPLVVR